MEIKKKYLKIVIYVLIASVKLKKTQIDNAEDIDVVIPMYNLIEYSNNYSKKSFDL